jgi:hypothetical protein
MDSLAKVGKHRFEHLGPDRRGRVEIQKIESTLGNGLI